MFTIYRRLDLKIQNLQFAQLITQGDVKMTFDTLKEELKNIIDINKISFNELMKNHTSFKVGGPADVFASPSTIEELAALIKFFSDQNIPIIVIGNGSNLLVKDGGIRGAVICLTAIRTLRVEGLRLYAAAGALLSAASNEALRQSLKGMEFASGIPGTVGGAVTMNAGAYGPEIKDIIEGATVMDYDGNTFYLTREELELSYRNSIIERKHYIVLEAVFKLEIGNAADIKNRMDELNRRRSDKQPLSYPSAGSTFKRPEGYFAAKLIEDSGLKGFSLGGAMVSEKHSGFIINYKDSTATDILKLIQNVKSIVNEKFGVIMETEVKIIGEE
jgi:UDP-N-acetylmuramate dehydrogenase